MDIWLANCLQYYRDWKMFYGLQINSNGYNICSTPANHTVKNTKCYLEKHFLKSQIKRRTINCPEWRLQIDRGCPLVA